MRSPFLALLVVLSVSSCTSLKYSINAKKVSKRIEDKSTLSEHFVGFILQDAETGENLVEVNPDKFFAPASNVKMITYFACLTTLGDSIPGLKYEVRNDTLYFTGTGDPSFLHPDFNIQRAYDFLARSEYPLVFVAPDFKDDLHAPGWTWEDYEYYYQVERNGFPMYGNAINFIYDSTRNSFDIVPDFFEDFIEIHDTFNRNFTHQRDLNSNIFHFAPDTSRSDYKNKVPFKCSDELTFELLKDTLNKPLQRARSFEFENPELLYSIPSKDLYYLMLQRSDNFIAEQLQYVATEELGLDMASANFRSYALNHELNPMRDQLIWKDGSGLSRYNLVTPRFMISLLNATLDQISMAELKLMLPKGGSEGTIKHAYIPDEGNPPYVFAKTGTFSNNHNLTGIIHTQSGRDLLFSFMNNNYKGSSYPVRKEMEKVLRFIYENY